MLDPEIGKSNFKVHMHDQSIISILTHRAGIKMLDFDIIDNNMNNRLIIHIILKLDF